MQASGAQGRHVAGSPNPVSPWLRRLSGLDFLLLGLICALSTVISAAAVSLASKPWAQLV